MPSRPVFDRELGRFFEELRLRRNLASQRQAAQVAKEKYHLELSYQTIRRLEAGQTKNPGPELLRKLATVYAVPYEELVERSVSRRFRIARDPIGHEVGKESGPYFQSRLMKVPMTT